MNQAQTPPSPATAYGFSLFAAASGLSPNTLRSAGHFKSAMDKDSGRARAVVKQRVVADGYDILHAAGMGATPCAIHLRKVASTAAENWTDHHFEVAEEVAGILAETAVDLRSEQLNKRAFTPANVSEALLNTTKAGALLAILTGVPLGAGYFALNRAFGDDSLEIKKKEQELQHFQRVGEKLQRRMSTKYGYMPSEVVTAYTPREAAYV